MSLQLDDELRALLGDAAVFHRNRSLRAGVGVTAERLTRLRAAKVLLGTHSPLTSSPTSSPCWPGCTLCTCPIATPRRTSSRWLPHCSRTCHSYTLVSKYRLALAVAGTGDRPGVKALLVALLADNVAALGEHHPYTSHARELLAQWEHCQH